MVTFDTQPKYHGYEIHGHGGKLVADFGEGGMYYTSSFRICKAGREIFAFSCRVTTLAINTHGKSNDNAPIILCEEGLKYAHGLIDLQRFEEGATYQYWVTFDKGSENLPDSEIRSQLLRALYNIRRGHPRDYMRALIDVEGFCTVLGISKEEYLFNANYLLEKGLIGEVSTGQPSVETGNIYITDRGIDQTDSESRVGNVIATIFNETQRFVNAELVQVCPEASKKLSETYESLLQDHTPLRVKQTAFACRDILQDFTDAIYDGECLVGGKEPPAREHIKNKVRDVLRKHAVEKSETTRELVQELSEYLNNYFDKLNAYIQKSIHADDFRVTTEDANRCVIYTYLVIADILRLLRI